MKDKEFYELMVEVQKANLRHYKLSLKLDEEYKSRFGYLPAQVASNLWIDTFSYVQKGTPNFDDIMAEATEQYNRVQSGDLELWD